MRPAGTACFGAAILLVGCGADKVPDPTRPSSAEPWQMIEELRLGAVDGGGPDVFGRITGLEVDEDGRIYVLDAQAREIRVFDRDGNHLRSMGRRGQGPGELETVTGFAWDPAGTLWVPDLVNARYAIFDPEEGFLAHVARPRTVGATSWRGTIDSTGVIWEPDVVRGSPRVEQMLLRVSSSGEVQDTVPLRTLEIARYEFISPAVRMFAVVPYALAPRWAVAGDGSMWLATTEEYRLVKTSASGDTLLTIEEDYEPVRVTARERTQALETDPGASRIRELGGRTDPELIPSYKPAFNRFELGRDGSVWVWRSVPEGELPLIDVFGSDGRYLGSTLAPRALADSPRPVISDDHMTAVVLDELRVPGVARFRIER